MRLVRQILLLALIPLLAMLNACGDDDGETSDTSDTSSTTAASSGTDDTSDGESDLAGESIVLYSGRDEELVQPIVDAFTEETGIEVEVRYGNSAEMGAQLLEEGTDTPADVFYSQEVGAVGALAKAGLMADLPQETVDRVDERFRPAEGTPWVGVTARSRVIVYNPDVIADLGIETPETVLDLTDPQYEGHVAIVPGNASFQAFITAFRVQAGEDAARQWLEAMIDNGVDSSYERNGDVLEAVNNGDIAIGLINHYYWARHENRDSLTAQLIFPTGDDPGGLVNATAAGITQTGADNPAAVAFIDYLLSEDGQETFVEETWEYPVVDGIDDPEGIPPLEELEGPPLDLTDLDSLEQSQTMLTDVGLLG